MTYKLTLIGHDYANVDGEYKRVNTTVSFHYPTVSTLLGMVERMIAGSNDKLELTITPEEDDDE